MKRQATISREGSYRYTLERSWGDGSRVLFVMLNPSTADAKVDDATIRRCTDYAKQWGYGGLLVGNLFALRSTDPQPIGRDPQAAVGPRNNLYLRKMSRRAGSTIVAWGGGGGKFPERIRDVLAILGPDVFCVGTTEDGHPRHPLYRPRSAEREVWTPG